VSPGSRGRDGWGVKGRRGGMGGGWSVTRNKPTQRSTEYFWSRPSIYLKRKEDYLVGAGVTIPSDLRERLTSGRGTKKRGNRGKEN